MGEPQVKPSERPWHVVTTDGSLHSGCDTEGIAKATAEGANERAKELGIVTRYEVKENVAP